MLSIMAGILGAVFIMGGAGAAIGAALNLLGRTQPERCFIQSIGLSLCATPGMLFVAYSGLLTVIWGGLGSFIVFFGLSLSCVVLSVWRYRRASSLCLAAFDRKLRICPACLYGLDKKASAGTCSECGRPWTVVTLKADWKPNRRWIERRTRRRAASAEADPG